MNYPNNVLPILKDLTRPFFTIGTSIVLIGLFLLFLWNILKETIWFTWAAPLSLITLAIIAINFPLLSKQIVPLTKLTPFISEQGYGQRMTNMPVNAFLGSRYWSPLSTQYYFYKKGIGTHAKSRLAYDLNRNFRKFSTDYGLDTESGEKASSTFEIWGDDKRLFISEKMGRYDSPRHIEVDVTNVKTLTLITGDAGDGIMDDHTDWLNPTLWP